MSGYGRMNSSARKGGFVFTAPAGTSIVKLTLDRAAVPDSSFNPATYWVVSQGLAAEGRPYELEACTAGSGLCSAGRGSFTNRADPTNRVTFGGFRAQQVFAYLATWPGGTDTTAPISRFSIFGAVVSLNDDSPPIVDLPTGALTTSEHPLSGDVGARITAKDSGGGIASVGLLVDDQIVVERPVNAADANCRRPYTLALPCPTAIDTAILVDTTRISDGLHHARVFATDAAGNRGASSPFLITVRNERRPNGLNATRLARLKVWMSVRKARRSSVTLSYGGSRTVRGLLTSPDGTPISGATIDIVSTDARVGAPARTIAHVTTGADGGFTYRPKAGPSRTFTFGYRAYVEDESYAAADVARVSVRAGIALRALPRRLRNGRTVTFKGRLVGGPGRSDVLVVVYAIAGRGPRARIPVEAVRTDSSGRFRLRYRFRTVSRRTVFRFNARAQRQSGYPYASGVSRPVAVTVTAR